MAGASNPAIDTGGGGLSNQSAASATSGDITTRGDRAYGGINIGSPAAFQLNPTTLAVIGLAVAGFMWFTLRKRR